MIHRERVPSIAVVSMGEMGSGIAALLVENGVRVLSSLEGRSAASVSRARAAGVENLDDAAMIEQADMVLSIVPPSAACATAERFMPLIEKAAGKPTFLECNAIAPQKVRALSTPFTERSLRFGDAAIIGLSHKLRGTSPRFYMSGPIEVEAELLRSFGLDAIVLSGGIGAASALKMAYAGINKGFQAIGTAMILGAARNGAAESLISELQDSQPEFSAWLRRKLPSMYSKAYRWDDEMREIADFLEPERGAADMLTGAADLYRHIADEYAEGATSEVISAIERFCRPVESPKG